MDNGGKKNRVSIETCKTDDHEKSKGVQRKERVKGGWKREWHPRYEKCCIYKALRVDGQRRRAEREEIWKRNDSG